MSRDDIIRMARKANLHHYGGDVDDALGRFANLIRNDYSTKHAQLWLRRIDEAIAAEREACARVCDDISAKYKWPDDTAEKVASQWCADRIRERGQA
jgi:hypothetical protein